MPRSGIEPSVERDDLELARHGFARTRRARPGIAFECNAVCSNRPNAA